ncbi:MAG: hypothetical protein ACLR3C_17555 [Eggerthella lenta]
MRANGTSSSESSAADTWRSIKRCIACGTNDSCGGSRLPRAPSCRAARIVANVAASRFSAAACASPEAHPNRRPEPHAFDDSADEQPSSQRRSRACSEGTCDEGLRSRALPSDMTDLFQKRERFGAA